MKSLIETTWFYCEDCGELFIGEDATFQKVENRHWWLDDCPVETWTEMYCPCCGSPAIYEAPECDGCGDVFRPQDLIDGFCEQCRKEEWSDGC